MSTLDDAELVQAAAGGDPEAFGELFERWFDRAFDVAWHIVRNRDTAAEVTQEAFAVAWHQIEGLRQPASFGGWLLRITRNKGLSRLARDRRTSLVGDDGAMETLTSGPQGAAATDAVIERERDALVWAASAVLGPDDASLLNLHLRHGLDAAELAGELSIQANAVHQRLFRLKRRLGDAIGAWVLWREGEPSCPRLRSQLEATGPGGMSFSRPTAAAIVAHARDCTNCTHKRQLRLSPEALFSAVPIVAAGPVVRADAAAALEGFGVPAGHGSTRGSGLSGEQPSRPPSAEAEGGRGGLPGRRSTARTTRTARTAAIVAAAAVALLVSLVVLAEQAGDGPDETAADVAISDRDTTDAAAADQTVPGSSPASGSSPAEASASTEPAGGLAPPPDPAPGSEEVASTTTTTTTSPPPSPPPTIGGFRATSGSGTCPRAGENVVVLVWSSTDATTATLGPTGGLADQVDTSGSTSRCSAPGTTWVLTVAGPGGSATDTATPPSDLTRAHGQAVASSQMSKRRHSRRDSGVTRSSSTSRLRTLRSE